MKSDKTVFTLYKIYYGDELVYVGRTKQPLQDRIRGHVFKQKLLRAIDIDSVSKIEYTTCATEADMFFYEIYYINLYHPKLNKDDKAHDELTVRLPSQEFKTFVTPLWDKWKKAIHEKDRDALIRETKLEAHREKFRQDKRALLKEFTDKKISDDEYWDKLKLLEEEDARVLYELKEIDFFEYKERMGFKEVDIL